MKRFTIFILFTLIIINLSYARIVPGKFFSGKIKKLNKKDKFVIVKKNKFYFKEKFLKVIEDYFKRNKKINFYYLDKNGKKLIIYIKKVHIRSGF